MCVRPPFPLSLSLQMRVQRIIMCVMYNVSLLNKWGVKRGYTHSHPFQCASPHEDEHSELKLLIHWQLGFPPTGKYSSPDENADLSNIIGLLTSRALTEMRWIVLSNVSHPIMWATNQIFATLPRHVIKAAGKTGEKCDILGCAADKLLQVVIQRQC